MKNIFKQNSFYWILSVLMVFVFASCKKDDKETGGKGAPKIERVRYLSKTDTIPDVSHPVNLDSTNIYDDIKLVSFDSTVVNGRLNMQYGIVGENLLKTTQVFVNGKQVYFNPALVTDKLVIFTVSSDVPFGATQTNKLTVVTTQGRVDYDFGILQPPPTITSFTPLAASTGDIVTITGTVLGGASSVKFDDVEATIIGTPTDTEIKVAVPAGVVQAYIFVTTAGGTSRSAASFGFKSVLYDEALQNGWGNYDGYGSTRNFKDTQHPKRGLYAIATTVDNGYGALQIGYGGATLNPAAKGFTALKFSIYGGAGIKDGDRIRIVLNYAYGDDTSVVVTMKAGVYTDYTIPLSQLGNPGDLKEIVMQTQGTAAPATFYVDDIGFI